MNPFRKTVSPNTSPKTRGIKVSTVRARFERWQHTVIQYRSERTGGRKRWERYFNKGEQNKSKEEEAAVPPRTSRKELKERGGNSGGNSSPSRCLVVPKRREGTERIRRRSRVGNVGRMRRMPAAKRSVTRLAAFVHVRFILPLPYLLRVLTRVSKDGSRIYLLAAISRGRCCFHANVG